MVKIASLEIEKITGKAPEHIVQEEVAVTLNTEFFEFLSENEVYRFLNNLYEAKIRDINFFRKAKGQELITTKDFENKTSTLLILNGLKFIIVPDFFEIVPKDEAIQNLNALFTEKAQFIKNQAYWARLGNEEVFHNPFQNYLDYKTHVAGTLQKNAQKEGWEFDFSHEYIKGLLSELTAYFGGFSERLNKLDRDNEGGIRKRKGLLLVGGKGLGKTFILKSFRQNPYQSYIVKTARELSKMVKEGDTANFERICYKWYTGHHKPSFFGQKRLGLMIDDIGTEDTVVNYGNVDNVIADILLVRYENGEMRTADTPNLFMTTNLSIEQLENKYGSRVWDRMKEILNIYVLDENLKSLRQ